MVDEDEQSCKYFWPFYPCFYGLFSTDGKKINQFGANERENWLFLELRTIKQQAPLFDWKKIAPSNLGHAALSPPGLLEEGAGQGLVLVILCL